MKIKPLNRLDSSSGSSVDKPSKRTLILKAAIDVFARQGFHHSRVSDVAKAAGVADGTIYNYFKSKDELLISLFEEKMEGIVETLRAEVDPLDTAFDRLRRFVEVHLMLVAEQPALTNVLTLELRQSAKFMREYKAPQFTEYLTLLGEIIEYGQSRGEIKTGLDPILTRRILFGALDELSLYWVSTKRKSTETLNQAVDELWSICHSGVFIPST
jgi:TetR/AcrR family fatty acid metabolism transcriptional regulator